MKKIILIVAGMGMLSGALAGGAQEPGTFPNPFNPTPSTSSPNDTTTVKQDVLATVANVCTYNPDNMDDVNGKEFKNADVTVKTNYKANKEEKFTKNFFIFRCTSGTQWDGVNGGYQPAGTLALKYQGQENGAHPDLNVDYVITPTDTPNTSKGDIHSADITFTIPAGQWQTRAGAYKNTLSVVISYN